MNTYYGRGGTVYGLFHPRTRRLRYVGATTTSLERRLSRHLAHARQAGRSSPLVRWLRTLDRPPLILALWEVHSGGADVLVALESATIAEHREVGLRLLNARRPGRARMWDQG